MEKVKAKTDSALFLIVIEASGCLRVHQIAYASKKICSQNLSVRLFMLSEDETCSNNEKCH